MRLITIDWLVRERLREVSEQLAFARMCLAEPTRGRKHNQTGKFKRTAKNGQRR